MRNERRKVMKQRNNRNVSLNVQKGLSVLVLLLALVLLPSVCAEAKWVNVNGKYRYTTNSSGTKYYKNTWKKINGKYYYFNKKGYRKTGWLTYNGKKYYLNKKGVRVTGFQTIKGKQYYFNSKGVMITGWIKYQSNYYYLNSSGVVQTGLLQIGDYVYYFDSTGRRVSDVHITLGNMVYYFATNGTLQYNGTEEENAVKYVNVQRILAGYEPLEYVVDSNLTRAAYKRAVELASVTSHTRPDGSSYATVLTVDYPVAEYWSGECILWGNAKKGVQTAASWLADQNVGILLQKEADAIGVAKYTDGNGCEYWVAIVIQKR
jgi:uncharacterized protein YkwD